MLPSPALPSPPRRGGWRDTERQKRDGNGERGGNSQEGTIACQNYTPGELSSLPPPAENKLRRIEKSFGGVSSGGEDGGGLEEEEEDPGIGGCSKAWLRWKTGHQGHQGHQGPTGEWQRAGRAGQRLPLITGHVVLILQGVPALDLLVLVLQTLIPVFQALALGRDSQLAPAWGEGRRAEFVSRGGADMDMFYEKIFLLRFFLFRS